MTVDYAMLFARGPNGSLAADVGTPTTAEITHPFWEFEWALIYQPEVAVCCVILFFAGILCSAAGIGGGGIYVAVLMVSGRLSPHNAVPLSKAIVFFGSVASLVVNLFSARMTQKSVIDTDACRLVVPATLIGTFVGVLLNRHTSDYVIVILLTLVLGLMTGMVARTVRAQAMAEHDAERTQNADSMSSTQPPVDDDHTVAGDGDGAAASASTEAADVHTPLLAAQHQEGVAGMMTVPVSRKGDPSGRDALAGGCLLFVVVTGGILRFHMHACRAEVLGDVTKVGACSHPVNMIFRHHMQQWMSSNLISAVLEQLVWSLPIWTCLGITVHFGFVANRDVGWESSRVLLYQAVAVMTGLLAGLVGVGGGLILSPFFLLTGMHPAIAVGTSATCVLFTSSSTTIQYMFTDRIIMSLAIVYGMVTLVASFVGTCLVHVIQDRFARKSYITTIVAVGVAISAMLSVVKFVYLVANPKENMEAKITF